MKGASLPRDTQLRRRDQLKTARPPRPREFRVPQHRQFPLTPLDNSVPRLAIPADQRLAQPRMARQFDDVSPGPPDQPRKQVHVPLLTVVDDTDEPVVAQESTAPLPPRFPPPKRVQDQPLCPRPALRQQPRPGLPHDPQVRPAALAPKPPAKSPPPAENLHVMVRVDDLRRMPQQLAAPLELLTTPCEYAPRPPALKACASKTSSRGKIYRRHPPATKPPPRAKPASPASRRVPAQFHRTPRRHPLPDPFLRIRRIDQEHGAGHVPRLPEPQDSREVPGPIP